MLLVVWALAVGAWGAGTFDHALAPLGLNAQDCARNGFGATFCGDALDRYRRDVALPAREHEMALRQGEEADALREQYRERIERELTLPVYEDAYGAPCEPEEYGCSGGW